MSDRTDKAISTLRDQLAAIGEKNVGIAMGYELYMECRRRGLIKMAVFSFAGSGAFPLNLPAFEGQFFVCLQEEFGDWEFQIGREARQNA